MNNTKIINYIDAIEKFNEKHKKYKVYYNFGNSFLFQIMDQKEETFIKFSLKIDDTKTIDEIVEILEDLKKDLNFTGKKIKKNKIR